MKPWECNLRHCWKVDGVAWERGELDVYGTVVARNGRVDYKARCGQCGNKSGAIPYVVWQEWAAAGAEITWAETRESNLVCAVADCDSTLVEIHHFAPTSLFGHEVGNKWPTAPLCPDHHRYWHRVMKGGAA